MSRQIRFSAAFLIGSAFALGGLGPATWAMSEPQADTIAEVSVEAIAQSPASPEEFTVIHVNAQSGDDSQGDGTQLRPYQTITHALSLATEDTLILLAGGTYSADSGETFPLVMKSQVTLQGMAGPNAGNTIIQGNGNYYSNSSGVRQIAILGAHNAGLANITVSNPHPEGVGLWIESGNPIIVDSAFVGNGLSGIYIAGNGSPVIRGNYFSENGQAGLVIAGPSSAEVEANVFDNTGAGITVAPEATPQILNNRISRNLDGLIVHAEAQPVLSGNQITRNRRNSIIDYAAWSTMPALATTGATQPPPPSQPTASIHSPTTSSTDSFAATEGNAAASPIAPPPAPVPSAVDETNAAAIVSPPVAPSNLTETAAAAIALPSTQSATWAEPEPAITAIADLGENLSDDLANTSTALSLVNLPAPPAIAAQSTLEQLDFSPMLAASENLSQNFESAAADVPMSEAPDDDSLNRESFEPLPLPDAVPPVRQPESLDSHPTPDAVPIPVTPAPSAPLPQADAPASPNTAPLDNAATPEPIAHDLPELPPPDLEGPALESETDDSQPLRVPGGNIPMGSGGELPELFTTGAANALPAGSPPPPPSLATSLGLNYRVLVAAADPAAQAQIREHVSDAFRVRRSDRTYMQVGAYPTLEEAQAQAERLDQLGIQAQIEEIP